jgi:glycosyltransferase involved in cell wall biosynthesis
MVETLATRPEASHFVLFAHEGNITAFRNASATMKTVIFPEWACSVRPLRMLIEHVIVPAIARLMGIRILHYTGSIFPLLRLTRVVATIHWVPAPILIRSQSKLKAFYFTWFHPFAVRVPDRFIAVSDACRDDFVEAYRLASDRITVIHHGVGEEFLTSNGVKASQVGRVGVNTKYLVCVTTDAEYKNLPTLVSAFAILIATLSTQVQLVLVGNVRQSRLEEIQGYAAVRDRITLAGYVDHGHLPALLSHASVMVYPSLRETFGIPVLEGMASRVPLVISNIPALVEVAGGAALAVSPMDAHGFADAIRRLLTEPALAQELVERGFDRAREFSWPVVAAQTIAVYERVLGRSLVE